MGATSPERHREVAVTPLQSDLVRATPRCRSRFHRSEARERPYQSDAEKSLAFSSLAFSSLGGTRATRSDVSQRPLQVAPEAWSDLSERLLEVLERSGLSREPIVGARISSECEGSLQLGATSSEQHSEVARVFAVFGHEIDLAATFRSDTIRVAAAGSDVFGATQPGRSRFRGFWARNRPRSDVPQRHHKVAPAGSDVTGATQRDRSRLWRRIRENRSRSDLLERAHEVAPSGSDVFGATQPGRSRRNDPGATSRSDTLKSLPSRSSLFLTTHSPFPFIQSKVPMVKKTKEKSDAEKQEAERQESALRGKALSSEQIGSGTHGTSR
ncbi:hypothetical protein F2Q70_00044599 [Brassica cretica]|uniref:Uncharacterized protein n=1 Tax=Brassica cretica TaxID=69181 RepID=A0A8S9KMW2_BRACR|nr:hypothetical protein F2Q70_00044599 [Brassica cretica]